MSIATDEEARAVIGRLLAAAGKRGHVDDDVEAADFDWSSPHRFNPEQREHLAAFGADAGRRMGRCLAGLLRGQWNLPCQPMREHYAGTLQEEFRAEGSYCVAITRGGATVGLFALPPSAAMSVMQRLLGGQDEVEDGRELSALEQALFVDTLAELARELSEAFEEAGGPHLSRGDELFIGSFPLPGDADSQFGGFEFLAEADEKKRFRVYLLSDVLAEACCGKSAGASPEKAGEDLMIENLNSACFTATVEVGRATLSVRDIMSLEPGDVILLEQEADAPIDLVYQGRPLLKGYPGRSEQRYALQVHSLCGTGVA